MLEILKTLYEKGKIIKGEIPEKVVAELVEKGFIYLRKGTYWSFGDENFPSIIEEQEYYYLTASGEEYLFDAVPAMWDL